MNFALALIINLALGLLQMILAKPPPGPDKPTSGDITPPPNAEGQSMPLSWGFNIIDVAIVDYGDFEAVEVEKKVGKK